MKLRQYPKYRESGFEWLGEMPADWRLLPLKAMYKRKSDRGHDGLPLLSVYRDYGVIPKDSRDDNFNKPSLDLSPYLRIQPNDLVTNKMKTWQGSIAISEYEGIVSPAYYTCSPLHSEHHRYIHYLLRCEKYVSIYMTLSKGIRVNQWDLEYEVFRDIPILLPSIYEQQSIASFLDRETARIDGLIEKKQRQIELLQEKRAALISNAVTNGLNPNVKMKDSGIEWLGEVPEHWERRRIKTVGRIQYGLGEPPELDDDGVPFIRATDVHRGKINGEQVQRISRDHVPWSRAVQLRAGDILVVRSGAYTGDSAVVPDEWVNSIAGYDMVLRPTHASPYFLAYTLLSQYVLEGQIYPARNRAAQPHLNAEELGEIEFTAPPLEEQEQIASFLDRETARIDKLIEKVDVSIDKLREYRTALISAAVTGKIDVREEAA